MNFAHSSVLLKESIEHLNIKPDGIYLDGTAGGGGHSEAIAKCLTKGRLFAMDQDEDAIQAASARLSNFTDQVQIIRGNFANAKEYLSARQVPALDGILLDLGVSSYQFDSPERGFSYRFDGPLDMRMDQSKEGTAAIIVNEYSQERLARIIEQYGEEKFAKNIAKHIINERAKKRITTTFELNDIIKAAIPARMRRDGHPSKRTFQALRIECNQEL
ncbi:MAG: 16S rRNA (cytosine(1402)-N(4))-methyltransferase RsmH, partial [Lachnospiraceae bacterium]|nr:16S rRNA (cytosine(1402)-N(4))-methyltransferase RsmH [Lachnospiraceae bacterium]